MRDTLSPLHGANLSMAAFLNQPAQWQASVLGARCFSEDVIESRVESQVDSGMQGDLDMPCMHVPMQRLDVGDSICEVWRGSGPLTQGRCGDIHYRHDDGVLFGVIVLSETGFAAAADKTPLQQATESAYRQMFALLDTLHFPYLFRCWNYLADINTHSFGLERYRQFNQGRQDAFLAHGREVVGNVPAASALGFGSRDSAQGSLAIAFLAGRVAPLNIENPRQVSAYEYPPQYGPRTPTFSRASLVRMGQEEVLFVSGTASIVGHATMHSENVVAQTRETMTNIEAVLAEANRLASQPRFNLRDLHYMVYVRDPVDLKQIRAELAQRVGDTLNAVYLQADVCRADLLLEIEATAAHPAQSMAGQRG